MGQALEGTVGVLSEARHHHQANPHANPWVNRPDTKGLPGDKARPRETDPLGNPRPNRDQIDTIPLGQPQVFNRGLIHNTIGGANPTWGPRGMDNGTRRRAP